MKKNIIIFLLASLMISVGCNKEPKEDSGPDPAMEARIMTLRLWQKQMTDDIAILRAIVADGDMVTSVEKETESNGYIVSFKLQQPLSFSKTLVDTETPLIGLARREGDDNSWYWTLNGKLLTNDSGDNIRANHPVNQSPEIAAAAIVPKIIVGKDITNANAYYAEDALYISVDNGSLYRKITDKSVCGNVSAFDLDNLFTSDESGIFTFRLADGSEIRTAGRPPLKVSILGDSYTTFKGWMNPSSNVTWYPTTLSGDIWGTSATNDVTKVEQTWWYKLINNHGLALERNNSWSGATVSRIGWDKSADKQDENGISKRSFIKRVKDLGEPDIIFIVGGANDLWASVPVGEAKYSAWDNTDRESFAPAFAEVLDYATTHYDSAKIYNLMQPIYPENGKPFDPYKEAMTEICLHYSVTNIDLENGEIVLGEKVRAGSGMSDNHPMAEGMNQIYEIVLMQLKADGIVK